jgi:large repetitive protein
MIRLSGQLNLSAGDYQFKVRADDGYSIRINGEVVAEKNRNQSPTTDEFAVFKLTEDGPHQIEIIFWDQGGQAQLKVELREDGGAYNLLGSESGQLSYVIYNEEFITTSDSLLVIDASSLLINDTDPEGQDITITAVNNSIGGSVELDEGGNILFTPDINFVGEATFDYTIVDTYGSESSATVTVLVNMPTPNLLVSTSEFSLTSGDISIYTGSGIANGGSGILASEIELALELTSGALSSFNPTGGPINHNGLIEAVDGKYATQGYLLSQGMTISFDWSFINGENKSSEIQSGFNDYVALVVTQPNGSKLLELITASELLGAGCKR